MDKNTNKETILNYIETLDPSENVPDDSTLIKNKIKSDVEERQETYKNILEAYCNSIKKNFVFKGIAKTVTWAVVTFVFISISIKSIEILEKCLYLGFEKQVPVVLASFGSFLTVIIAIPKIITAYIFNKEEDKYMVQILKKIVDFDKNVL